MGPLLVIGAGGFVGAHFVEAAESSGHEVIPTSRAGHGGLARCDLLDPDSIATALAAAKPSVVVNLAGAASASRSFGAPGRTFDANCTGVVNLLEAAKRHTPSAQILCISSGDVYGDVEKEALPIDEECPARPLSPYASSKASMEIVCGQYARTEGLRVAILRAFNHTGPGQGPVFAMSNFAQQIAQAEAEGVDHFTLNTGNLDLVRDFSDVRDIARAYVAVCESGLTGVYNVCSGRGVALRSMVDSLKEASTLAVEVAVDAKRLRPNEAAVIYGSATRLEREVGWNAQIPISRTLGDLLDWWRERLKSSAARPH